MPTADLNVPRDGRFKGDLVPLSGGPLPSGGPFGGGAGFGGGTGGGAGGGAGGGGALRLLLGGAIGGDIGGNIGGGVGYLLGNDSKVGGGSGGITPASRLCNKPRHISLRFLLQTWQPSCGIEFLSRPVALHILAA